MADKDNLVGSTKMTFDSLENKGYSIVKVKNTWTDVGNPYNGINVQLEAPNGQKFELQFHTQESFELKNSEAMHSLYEQARVLEPNSDEYFEIEDKMFELSDSLEVPVNIESIENHKR